MPFAVAKDAGDLTTFNIHHGFPEGLVRGYRSGFLSDQVSVVAVCAVFKWFDAPNYNNCAYRKENKMMHTSESTRVSSSCTKSSLNGAHQHVLACPLLK